MRKWAMMSVQKCRSNSKICQISLCQLLTIPKVGAKGLDLTAEQDVVLSAKFWVLNEQLQAFA
jgi:hypothetical protein